MKLSDLDPNEVEVVEPQSSGLKLSDLSSDDIEVVSSGPQVSQLESLGRGGLQGLTFGAAEEVYAGGKSALQSLMESAGLSEDNQKGYEQQYLEARDAERAANKAAEQANPATYLTGDIAGSVLPALFTGGTGLIGAGLKTGAKEAIKRGGTKSLMALGAAEGAAHGLGRSEGTDALEVGQDVLTGGLIGGAVPGLLGVGKAAIKGTAGLVDTGLTKMGPLGDVYTHIKDVAKEGSEDLGSSFKQASQKALSKLKGSAGELKEKALDQEIKYSKDLLKGQEAAATGLDVSSTKLKGALKKSLDVVGESMDEADQQIQKIIESNPVWHLRSTPEGLQLGRFNFDPLDKVFAEVGSSLDQPRPILEKIQRELKDADYLTVTKKLRDINRLMSGNVSPNDFHQLSILKDSLQDVIDSEASRMPGEAGKLYALRTAEAKKYSQLAQARQKLSAQSWKDTGDLSDAAKFMANTTETGGKPLLRSLETAKQVGSPEFGQSADELLESAGEFNRFKINPKMGEMFDPLTMQGQNERQLQQFTETFGKPKEFGMSSSFAKTLEDLSENAQGISPSQQKEQLVDYIRNTYGEKADKIISQLQEQSKKFKTLEAGLDKNAYAGQDVSSWIRILKKAADPVSFVGGQVAQKISDIGTQLSAPLAKKGFNKAAAMRTLTNTGRGLITPKQAAQDFKNSQKNGGSSEAE